MKYFHSKSVVQNQSKAAQAWKTIWWPVWNELVVSVKLLLGTCLAVQLIFLFEASENAPRGNNHWHGSVRYIKGFWGGKEQNELFKSQQCRCLDWWNFCNSVKLEVHKHLSISCITHYLSLEGDSRFLTDTDELDQSTLKQMQLRGKERNCSARQHQKTWSNKHREEENAGTVLAR